MAQNIDQFINDFSDRITKEMQLFKGEIYCILCTLIAMGLKIFCICLKIDVLYILREVKCPWPIVQCE